MGLFTKSRNVPNALNPISLISIPKKEKHSTTLVVPTNQLEMELVALTIREKLLNTFGRFSKPGNKTFGIFIDSSWTQRYSLEYYMSPHYYGSGLFGLEIEIHESTRISPHDPRPSLAGLSLAVALSRHEPFGLSLSRDMLAQLDDRFAANRHGSVNYSAYWIYPASKKLPYDGVILKHAAEECIADNLSPGHPLSWYGDTDFEDWPHRCLMDLDSIR